MKFTDRLGLICLRLFDDLDMISLLQDKSLLIELLSPIIVVSLFNICAS